MVTEILFGRCMMQQKGYVILPIFLISCRPEYQDDSSSVSVFAFEANDPQRRDLLPLAKNALRKLRTTRHPDVLRFIDVVETESSIHIVTERVQPLWAVLERWSSKPAKSREEWLVWGLHRISVSPSHELRRALMYDRFR